MRNVHGGVGLSELTSGLAGGGVAISSLEEAEAALAIGDVTSTASGATFPPAVREKAHELTSGCGRLQQPTRVACVLHTFLEDFVAEEEACE